ncbi:hypothetical protein [Epiphyas postvittana nucleopolyhedrovirus]|uniref:Fusion protein n=1 Tax=Epiphyas postvittana nucleopolyhedrovirus TaxID=70600 RepID=Q91GN0_NPVEP|nr:hypothetical protein [Epiphyas postvittana nucleopolyhedrovirus]AAK85583.1 unknown [Epiphyas postvittana nucleopolyhedrovirus]
MHCLIIYTAALVLSGTSASKVISFEPINDASGLLFERIAALRHVSDERFVFVKSVDFTFLLQELAQYTEFLTNKRANATTCAIKLIKPHKPMSTKNRIKKDIASIKQLDVNFYEIDSNDMNNEVFDDEVDFNYIDNRQENVDYDNTHNVAHWTQLNISEARILLNNLTDKRVKVLPTVVAVTNASDINLKKCKDCNTIEEECAYLSDTYSRISRKFVIAAAFANTLDRLIKQTNRNKLNYTNNVLNDTNLLAEMRQLVRMLNNKNFSWTVDFEREMNARFDLSQTYKLHLYANQNVVVIFVILPLVKLPTSVYSLYKVVTVPFCRGTMCLMMVPSASYIAVTDTRNFYAPLPNNIRTVCKEFTGYDEFLCPETTRIATMESGVCEIEMFMGRYASDIDTLCDIRVADNNAKQVLMDTLVVGRKWLYSFAKNMSVGCLCNHYPMDVVVSVPPGVGLITTQPSNFCSIRIINTLILFNADTQLYATESITYEPRKQFDYNNYVDGSLLSQTSTPFADAVTDLTLTKLRLLRSRFHIRDYTAPPKTFFSPHNDLPQPRPDIVHSNNIVIVTIIVLFVCIVSALCVVMFYCMYRRHCFTARHNEIAVTFRNDEHQPIITINNDTGNRVNIAVPNNLQKAAMFPMQIKGNKLLN